jgi:MFS transporter, MHS family, citrate/tricarballylate:H+ symporter
MYCLPIGNKLLFYSAELVGESFMNSMPMEHNAAPTAALVPLKRMLAISLGNALEFYDFMIFSFFAVQIAHTIIPAQFTDQGLLLTLATFGVGFFTRPLGALVIGRYGDRAGRKPAMMWSFGLMGVSILGTALTPSYANIGVAAPALLLCFRLLQGFALGGEVGPITAYAAEAAPQGHRARYVSMLGTGQGLAVLCSGLIGYALARLLSPADLDSYGWRIALLLGVLVVPIGLLIRRRLPETIEGAVAEAKREAAAQSPWRVFFVGLLVVGAGTIAGYALTYLATYAQDTLKLGARLAFVATIAQGLGYLGSAYAAGWFGDRFGHRRILVITFTLLLLLMLPAFVLINRVPTAASLFVVTATLAAIHIGAIVCMQAFLVECLTPTVRSGVFAMTYATGVALLGGTTQPILKLLIHETGSAFAPPWYVIAALAIGLLALTQLREAPRESKTPASARGGP